jgi:U3 small nucleolar RNA-associated protein 25
MATDAFHTHFGPSPAPLTNGTASSVEAGKWVTSRSTRPGLGKVVAVLPEGSPALGPDAPADQPQVKLVESVYEQFGRLPATKANGGQMTALQEGVHAVVGQYQDLFLSRLGVDQRAEVKDVVLMHAVNHVLKTRRRILKMNEKLAHAAAAASEPSTTSAAAPAELDARDQGFTRPKILLLTPFRSSALAALTSMLALFPAGTQIENRQRFLDEFSLPPGTADRLLDRAGEWPRDHVETFAGNVDDNFRVGVKVTRKSVKLFGGFYGCDIVVGSPLGLRMSIEKEKCVASSSQGMQAAAADIAALLAGAPTSCRVSRSLSPMGSTSCRCRTGSTSRCVFLPRTT